MSYGIDQQKQGGRPRLLGTFPNALSRPKFGDGRKKMHQDEIPTKQAFKYMVFSTPDW